ncbi:uncharacterized protein [Periplaneta americana]|uniref:uncharacterized protein n=1 Tax=Periplaneta americana TaxID=6978 RepID=UPI0037E7A88B
MLSVLQTTADILKQLNTTAASQHVTFVVDMHCEGARFLLQQANTLKLFDGWMRWLLLDNSCSNPFSARNTSFEVSKDFHSDDHNSAERITDSCVDGDSSSPEPDSTVSAYIEAALEHLDIHPASDVMVAKRISKGRFVLVETYKHAPHLKLVKAVVGEWSRDCGMLARASLVRFTRRVNMQGTLLRAGMVVTTNDSLLHLRDTVNRHIDTIQKVNYNLFYIVADMINASVDMKVLDTWGYNVNGSWDGLVGYLERGEVDIGASPLFVTKSRLLVLTYTFAATPAKFAFLFRQPPLSFVNNVFALPFSGSVWLASMALMVVMCVTLRFALRWEYCQRAFYPFNPDDPLSKYQRTVTWSDMMLLCAGSISEQGIEHEARAISGRIITILLLVAIIFLYTSYSACIVALLQSSTSSIRSLHDLVQSGLSLGAHDIIYNRYYFQEVNDPDPVRRAVCAKLTPQGGPDHFMTLEEGVGRVRKGQFAFHMELGMGYKIIWDTFLEAEKCNLQSIVYLIEIPYPHIAMSKKTPYKEVVRVSYRKLHEVGLQVRENLRFYHGKPKCENSGSNFMSVGIVDFYPALLVVTYGVLLSITVLMLEIFVHKRQVIRLCSLQSKSLVLHAAAWLLVLQAGCDSRDSRTLAFIEDALEFQSLVAPRTAVTAFLCWDREASMRKAAMETVELNGNNRDICGAFDGSWQKRGHTSLNGVVTATSLLTGKVLAVEILTKYCQTCSQGKGTVHKCTKNYKGYSGGMEVQGAVNIFRQSEDSLNIRYVQYLGDGDSKGFKKVQEDKPYGEGVEIEKLECIGHVHKRMGARLGRLKKELKGIKLDDGKTLAGAGRLTNTEIDLFQTYYGLAIRRNTGNVEEMRKSVWATYFHKISTNEKPYHQLCPKGLDSWCGYNKAQAQNKVYDHRHSLPEAVMLKVKPIFRDLADKKLLEKCTHGCTQNPNESFNNCIWERLPKTVFVGLNVLKTGVLDAVITFNDGSSSRKKVLELMGIKPGLNMERSVRLLYRRLGERRRMMSVVETTGDASKQLRATDDHQHVTFLLDVNCEGASFVLQQAHFMKLLSGWIRWLLLDVVQMELDSTEMKGKYGQQTSPRNNSCQRDELLSPEISNVLQQLNVHPASDVTVGKQLCGGKFVLVEAYKHAPQDQLVQTVVGEWGPARGVRATAALVRFTRRTNLQRALLRAAMVVTNNDSLRHLRDTADRHVDTITKVNYNLLHHVAAIMNASVQIAIVNSWGYDINGSWDGMAGYLQRGEADVGATALFITRSRIPVMVFISPTTKTGCAFLFQRPPLSFMENIYTLPFSRSVWLASVALVAALCSLLYRALEWETRQEERPRDAGQGDMLLLGVGAVCQQSSQIEARRVPGRLVLLLLFTLVLILYTSYSACVVALLQSSSHAIRTLRDLLHSGLTLGAHDIVYNHYFFQTASDPVSRAIFTQKVSPPGGPHRFMSLEAGLKRVRKGRFAFHLELGPGYKYVWDTFLEEEKCSLHTITFLVELSNPHVAVSKDTPYQEVLRVSYRKLHERGLQVRENLRFYHTKPGCTHRGSSFVSVGVRDCYPALLLLLCGTLLAAILLAAEIAAHRRAARVQRVVQP